MSSQPPSATQQVVNLADAQALWRQWVEAEFPDLESRAYFLPPVYVNRVPMTRQLVAGQDVLVLESAPGQAGQSNKQAMALSSAAQAFGPQPPPVQDSDVRDDAAVERVLNCLKKISEQNKEVLVGLSQLKFEQYLGEPCYSAVAAQLPVADSLPSSLPKNWKRGDFDVLLIHRHYGFVVCEVKAFGDNIQELNMSQQNIENNIRQKLKQAVSQLDKSETMLSHLVSDIAPGLRITKTIAFPNLTARQLQQAISGDTTLSQDLCRCLGTSDPVNITGLCLCSDQLSDPKTSCDVSSHVLSELGHWWQRRVAGVGPVPHMTFDLYKTLVARFCGPATTVTVPCTCPPRVSVKTLGQAVSHTGQCYTAVITLFPEQVHLLHTAPPILFVTGPPGTGKTVMLLLMAIEWLRCGHHVYVVSTWWGSRAACTMLYHLLLFIEKRQLLSQKTSTQLHLLQYDVRRKDEAEKAVNELLQATIRGVAYVIADEVNGDFKNFSKRLVTKIPDVHVWAASCYHGDPPAGWQMEYLTRPLRSPPAVVREVEQSKIIKDKYVVRYSKRRVPDHTDGPPVTRLYHRGQGHSGDWPINCVTCGLEVARVLHSLRVGVTDTVVISGGTTPACLQWRDVLVLYGGNIRHISGLSVMRGMREGGILVWVMEDEDVDDVATARSDVVWMTNVERVLGLERKVIVHLVTEGDVDFYDRLQLMSRCTSQLLIVSPSLRHTVAGAQALPFEATESGSVSCTTQGTQTSSSHVSSTQLTESISSNVQSPLPQCDELFPDLQSRAYFLPSAYVSNRQMIGQEVEILHHEATKGLFFKLDKMSKHNGEVLVGISRLKFGLHLNEVSLAVTATQLFLPSTLPDLLPRNSSQGDTDVLLISRYYGIVVCEVKAIGDNKQGQRISEGEMDSEIRKKLQEAALHLDKDEAMLSDLVSDIAPGLPIIKTIVFPKITARQLQQAISGDTQLTQTLSQCLGSEDPSDICGLCLCSDDLSDPMTPRNDSSDVRKLTHWWRRRVAGLGVKGQMTCDVYKALVARLSGPATTVTVPCTCPPRVRVKTVDQAVSHTGECYTAVITLFPEQIHLLHTAPSRVFVTGPPGTGKTVVLLLMAIEWLRCGHHVYIVSTWWGSRATSTMLYHLLLFIEKRQLLSQKTSSQLHFLLCDVKHEEKAEKAVNKLLQATISGVAYVIADEVNGDFKNFGERLVTKIPDVHIWAASCCHGYAPAGWQMEYLTRPLRSPPAVVREVEQSKIIDDKYVLGYSKRHVPDHTDGPPVTRLYHGGQGHSGDWPINCVTCGLEVARVLHSLRVGVTDTVVISGGTTPACLQWRDVLVLYGGNTRQISGLSVMRGMREGGISVWVMEDEDVDDVATARSDVVWITNVERVLGLERKVIVHLVTEGDVDFYDRLQLMSRCTSQLLIVSPSSHHTVTGAQALPVEATESGSVSCTTQGTKTNSSPVSSTQLKEPVSSKVQSLWLQWDEFLFPDLQSIAYLLPPAYVSRRQTIGQEVQILHHEATKGLFFKLDKMSKHNGEVLVGISRLKFGRHLNEVSLAATATQLLLPSRLPDLLPRNSNQGDTDVLLISRYYGIVVCEVKAIGDNKQGQRISVGKMGSEIRKKLEEAALQLDEDEALLSDLVRDIAPGLPIIKTIVFPNITARQVQKAISGDTQLTQTLSQCLGSEDPSNICGLCLCFDDSLDPMTPCDDSRHLRKLTHWWRRRVAGRGVNGQMTCDVYKALVARLSGPAKTVTVPCTSPPGVSVKTLGQAAWWTGEFYTAVITLFPEQVHLLHTAPPRLFVTGSPGTGKTVVLLLMAIEWLRCGHHVYIVSTCSESRAASIMLYYLLLQTVKTQQFADVSHGQLHLLQYDLDDSEDVEKAVNDLSHAAIRGSLYVIADEVGSELRINNFGTFCDKLQTQVPRLHFWAASCFPEYTPAGWEVQYLTRLLRSPPVVDKEDEQDLRITRCRDFDPYSERGVPEHTDGPSVTRLYHCGQGHSSRWPGDCVTCGRELASFLHSLRVGVTESSTTTSTTLTSTIGSTTPPCLQWRDVLVFSWRDVNDQSGVITGLQEAGIPARVMKDDDIEDVATAHSDVVWVTNARVYGLERKVVVYLEYSDFDSFSFMEFCLGSDCSSRLYLMPRSASQRVIVSLYY